ncbi:MAG: hypothetical protein GYA21_10495 [Myxococcales bacterium]|nr:hypothetical protein [Myxococcales bacterium]
MRKLLLVNLSFLLFAACLESQGGGDGGQTFGTTTAYFAPDPDQPARSLLPLPNILAVNDTQPPTLSLRPSQCLVAGSVTEETLRRVERLDGYGTFLQGFIQAYFTSSLDEESLTDRVLLLDLGPYSDPARTPDLQHPIAVRAVQTQTSKYIQGCDAAPVPVPTVVFLPVLQDRPEVPRALAPDRLYGMILLRGIRDREGFEVLPSYAWTLVRSTTAQSDLALRLLQETHKPLLAAADALAIPRQDILLGWLFNTQSTQAALTDIRDRLGLLGEAFDTRQVTIPAASLPVPPLPPQQFLGALGLSCDAIGAGPNCPGIARFISADFVSPRFQQAAAIELPYLPKSGQPEWVPGEFSMTSPPPPQGSQGQTVPVLVSLPAGRTPPYPVVIFQHPLTPTDPAQATSANKLAMLSLANNLGAAGFALVAMDGVLAGGRQVLVKNGQTNADQLYPVMSSDLFATRDNLRQTVADLMQLVRVLKNCTEDTCAGLAIDPNRIFFLGVSLGSVTGAVFTALSPDVRRAVLNAPAAGLAQLLGGSPVLLAELSPVLCAAQVIDAACCRATPPRCAPQDLAQDAKFAQFLLTAQWVLDPADPINFAGTLAADIAAGTKRLMLQTVTGDAVFPPEGATLLGATLALPSSRLKSYDPGACASVPQGAHTMLLQNCGAGTVAMRTDLIQFFLAP